MAKLICTLRSTFPQVQPDIFKCSNCGCDEVRPHWKFCCNCGEQLTDGGYYICDNCGEVVEKNYCPNCGLRKVKK